MIWFAIFFEVSHLFLSGNFIFRLCNLPSGRSRRAVTAGRDQRDRGYNHQMGFSITWSIKGSIFIYRNLLAFCYNRKSICLQQFDEVSHGILYLIVIVCSVLDISYIFAIEFVKLFLDCFNFLLFHQVWYQHFAGRV
jgi:hypothetical protein